MFFEFPDWLTSCRSSHEDQVMQYRLNLFTCLFLQVNTAWTARSTWICERVQIVYSAEKRIGNAFQVSPGCLTFAADNLFITFSGLFSCLARDNNNNVNNNTLIMFLVCHHAQSHCDSSLGQHNDVMHGSDRPPTWWTQPRHYAIITITKFAGNGELC